MTAGELDSLPLPEAALWYALRGFPVFPCRPRGKEPLVEGGFHAATTDEWRIREWWRRWPEANIGVPTGAASGWLVVDIDPRNGGDEALGAWLAKYGRWAATCEATTGGGGRHILFRHVAGLRCGPLALGVDLKTDGGYIVVAPSVHPSGNRYSWDGMDGADSLGRLSEPPGWLLRLARERHTQHNSAAAVSLDEPIPEGRRNGTLFRLAASLRARGLSQAGIEAALLAENQTRCRPPLPESEVRLIAQSASRYPAGAVGGATTYEPPGGAVFAEVRIENPTIENLNQLALWGGRVAFTAVRRRGQYIEAVTTSGRLIRLKPADLSSFSKCQQAIAAGAGVWVPTPPRGKARLWWDAAASVLLSLADQDSVGNDDPLRLEAAALLRESWEAIGKPAASGSIKTGDLIERLKQFERLGDPLGVHPPVVFVAEGQTWVHPRKWRIWLGTPRGLNRHYTMAEIYDFLAALDFRPERDLTRQTTSGVAVKLDLWAGPENWITGLPDLPEKPDHDSAMSSCISP